MAKKPAKNRNNVAKPDVEADAVDNVVAVAETVEDAVVSEDIPAEEVVEEAAEAVAEDLAETVDEQVVELSVEDEAIVEETSETPHEITPSRQDSVFLPMVLGGLVAAGLGYGAAYFTRPETGPDVHVQLAEQTAKISELQADLNALPVAVEMAQVDEIITSAAAASMTEFAAISARIDASVEALDARVEALEKQPSADGTLQDTALAAYQRELDELRVEMQGIADAAEAKLAATRDEVAAIEQSAMTATALAALARLQGAMENGAPIGAALTDLALASGMDAPDALLAVTDGAPTLASLQSAFPDAARSALAAARSEGAAGEEAGGIGAFLRNQFDIRSVAPQEGDGVDAVLSRVESSLNGGHLSDALSEANALPEVARATLSEWLGQAEIRVDALAALEIISISLNDN